jgi:hypothetical protein
VPDLKGIKECLRLPFAPFFLQRTKIEEFGLFFTYGVAQRLGGGLEDLLVGLIDGVAD